MHRAARVGAAGHGGQILLTEATHALVGDADLIDLGIHELKESLEIAEELEAPLVVVCALEASAAVARMDGDDDRALEFLARADEVGRGGMVPLSYVVTVARALGELTAARGDHATGREYLERSLSTARQVGDAWGVARSEAAIERWGSETLTEIDPE